MSEPTDGGVKVFTVTDEEPKSPERERTDRRRGLSWPARLIFVLTVVLEALQLHFTHYGPLERLADYRAVWQGLSPEPVFYVIALADLAGMILLGRLILAVIREAGHRRVLTILLGLPLTALTFTGVDLAGGLLVENYTASHDLPFALTLLLALGLASAVAASLTVTLGVYEGSGRPGRWRFLLETIPVAAALGAVVILARAALFPLMLVPAAGPILRVALGLWLVLWFFGRLSERPYLDLGRPPQPGIYYAFAAFIVVFGLVGLAVVVPGPGFHSDAVEASPLVISDRPIYFEKPENLQDTVIVPSRKLKLVVRKDPFTFALLDQNKRVLIKLNDDEDLGLGERGICLNQEVRALPLLPGIGPDRLVRTRLRLRSRPLLRAEEIEVKKSSMVATGRLAGLPVAVSFSYYDEDVLRVAVEAGSPSPFRSTSITFTAGKDEAFIGGGTLPRSFNLRGRDLSLLAGMGGRDDERPGWIETLTGDRLRVRSGGDEWPVPFVFFARGVGVFMAENRDGEIDLAGRDRQAVRFTGRDSPVVLYIVTGSSPLEVVTRFQSLTLPRPDPGRPTADLLLPWGRVEMDEVVSGEALRRLSAWRALGVPVEYVVIRGSAGAKLDGAAAATLREAKKQGYRFLVEDSARVDLTDPRFVDYAREGLFVKNRLGLPYIFLEKTGPRALLDFNNPATAAARGRDWKALVLAGASGLVLDRHCYPPPDSIIHQGETGLAYRNRFPLVYAEAVRAALGPEAPIVTEAGYLGMERLANVMWFAPPEETGPLDARSDLIRLASLAVGGMAMAGPEGLPALPAKAAAVEAALQKSGLAGLAPVMVLPGRFDELDPQSPESDEIRNLAETHVRLLPHFYSLARTAARTGAPALFPPALLDPDQRELYEVNHEVMVGQALLAALPGPPGEATTLVRLPPGRWLHLESLQVYDGGVHEVPRKGARPLLFLRAGQILPLFPEPFDTLDPASEPVRTGNLDRDMVLTFMAGKDADLTLFDRTEISVRHAGESILIRSRGRVSRTYTLRIMSCPPPLSVKAVGKEEAGVSYRYLEQSRVLTVSGVPGPDFEMVVVTKTD